MTVGVETAPKCFVLVSLLFHYIPAQQGGGRGLPSRASWAYVLFIQSFNYSFMSTNKQKKNLCMQQEVMANVAYVLVLPNIYYYTTLQNQGFRAAGTT